jgi:hypothetical protein
MVAIPFLLSAAGFTTTGVSAGSLGAWLMSTGAKGMSGGTLASIGSVAGGLYVAAKVRKSPK